MNFFIGVANALAIELIAGALLVLAVRMLT